ncbi:hypothetical protein DPMN_059502 [Dreissena polymorpha]|uniref:Protein kinase domain-containing protein n=1 Tax=Dreissena polymorpha TaxID=45954 RepID=A0A9D4C491_DREPO|nr:hypothetical protein DPMN_059502 [Dreissena polymorpha]
MACKAEILSKIDRYVFQTRCIRHLENLFVGVFQALCHVMACAERSMIWRLVNGVLVVVSIEVVVVVLIRRGVIRPAYRAREIGRRVTRRITHRRLVAHNILLTFTKEVKIYGFGPQPQETGNGDAESEKKERIPIKWMAPECMTSTKDADEKSDVWLYGVVPGKCFLLVKAIKYKTMDKLNEKPFDKVKSRDLPDRLKKNVRLQKPERCENVYVNGVLPKERPTFTAVRKELDNMFVAFPGDDCYYNKC